MRLTRSNRKAAQKVKVSNAFEAKVGKRRAAIKIPSSRVLFTLLIACPVVRKYSNNVINNDEVTGRCTDGVPHSSLRRLRTRPWMADSDGLSCVSYGSDFISSGHATTSEAAPAATGADEDSLVRLVTTPVVRRSGLGEDAIDAKQMNENAECSASGAYNPNNLQLVRLVTRPLNADQDGLSCASFGSDFISSGHATTSETAPAATRADEDSLVRLVTTPVVRRSGLGEDAIDAKQMNENAECSVSNTHLPAGLLLVDLVTRPWIDNCNKWKPTQCGNGSDFISCGHVATSEIQHAVPATHPDENLVRLVATPVVRRVVLGEDGVDVAKQMIEDAESSASGAYNPNNLQLVRLVTRPLNADQDGLSCASFGSDFISSGHATTSEAAPAATRADEDSLVRLVTTPVVRRTVAGKDGFDAEKLMSEDADCSTAAAHRLNDLQLVRLVTRPLTAHRTSEEFSQLGCSTLSSASDSFANHCLGEGVQLHQLRTCPVVLRCERSHAALTPPPKEGAASISPSVELARLVTRPWNYAEGGERVRHSQHVYVRPSTSVKGRNHATPQQFSNTPEDHGTESYESLLKDLSFPADDDRFAIFKGVF